MVVRSVTAAVVVAACLAAACARPVISARPRTTPTPAATLAELWREPQDLERRNLLVGSGPPQAAPRTDVEYKVERRDESGYSKGYDVIGPDQRRWDIKVGKEVQPEIVLSRILWALGYYQPATYYVTGWRLAGEWKDEGAPARFRLRSDHEAMGEWQWLD